MSGYPGRGIVLVHPREGPLRWLYFLTGRSPSSKARRFATRGESLAVVPTEPGAGHYELRHYDCVTTVAGTLQIVVGNGDHARTIASSLQDGCSLDEAIVPLEPEPDPPINTPRIAAVLDLHHAQIVRVRRGRETSQTHRDVRPVVLEPGEGLVLHSCSGASDRPIGSAPHFLIHVPVDWSLPTLIWQALNPDHRVMLAAGSVSSVAPTDVLP